MPRNTQVARQLLLLRRLENPQGATLQELAEALPPDYPKNPRTIRRDMEALEGVHVPLVIERVDGQTRWKIMEGYRNTPALALSPTELMALIFSRNLLKPLEGTELHASLASALNKAAAALPAPAMDYVRRLEDTFSVGLGERPNLAPQPGAHPAETGPSEDDAPGGRHPGTGRLDPQLRRRRAGARARFPPREGSRRSPKNLRAELTPDVTAATSAAAR